MTPGAATPPSPAGPVRRPLLFLDVDGPLIPFGPVPGGHPTFRTASANPLLARVDPAHGPRLKALPCDLVWATTWMDDANDCVAPLLGLPRLPVATWPEPSELDGRTWLRGSATTAEDAQS
ncbi:hypothetical protein ACFFV7_09060 [Nonomuraea spiralis]|uniref:Secreted protein n=1 Tax=Nonomuraea spiralis TaxID=46182 RepID=A0ABV5I9X8_9ACTN|nr:hypothetical protein [Nonomuraea spiralis]GGT05840.1 hypothetical protein GCM10010176_057740 [Nonomuraea spiralis]